MPGRVPFGSGGSDDGDDMVDEFNQGRDELGEEEEDNEDDEGQEGEEEGGEEGDEEEGESEEEGEEEPRPSRTRRRQQRLEDRILERVLAATRQPAPQPPPPDTGPAIEDIDFQINSLQQRMRLTRENYNLKRNAQQATMDDFNAATEACNEMQAAIERLGTFKMQRMVQIQQHQAATQAASQGQSSDYSNEDRARMPELQRRFKNVMEHPAAFEYSRALFNAARATGRTDQAAMAEESMTLAAKRYGISVVTARQPRRTQVETRRRRHVGAPSGGPRAAATPADDGDDALSGVSSAVASKMANAFGSHLKTAKERRKHFRKSLNKQ